MNDDNNSFIDDASDISESVCVHYAFQNAEINIDDVLKNMHEKAIPDLDDASEFTNFSNPDLVEELPETATFCVQEKRVNDLEKSLLIPNDVGSIDSFFNTNCYAICYEKTEKVDHCNNFQDEIGTELHEKLLALKERLQLKLDHHRFEEQCFEINKALIKHGYFMKVFEAKKKFITVMKKDSEKQEMKKNVSSFIAPKFRDFDIVRIEYGREQRIKFRPIDIIYKLTKKWHDIIDCYFSTDLATAYRAKWSTGKSLRHAGAYHCYYCSSYYIQKAKTYRKMFGNSWG